MAAGVIYKSSARISAGGTALPIKRVATTRPSGNTKLSGRPWSRASSRTCSSRACVPSCHTYTALVVDTVGARPSSSYMRECWVLRRRKARWYRRGVRRVSGGRSARACSRLPSVRRESEAVGSRWQHAPPPLPMSVKPTVCHWPPLGRHVPQGPAKKGHPGPGAGIHAERRSPAEAGAPRF